MAVMRKTVSVDFAYWTETASSGDVKRMHIRN
jgi:hypothetical protein